MSTNMEKLTSQAHFTMASNGTTAVDEGAWPGKSKQCGTQHSASPNVSPSPHECLNLLVGISRIYVKVAATPAYSPPVAVTRQCSPPSLLKLAATVFPADLALSCTTPAVSYVFCWPRSAVGCNSSLAPATDRILACESRLYTKVECMSQNLKAICVSDVFAQQGRQMMLGANETCHFACSTGPYEPESTCTHAGTDWTGKSPEIRYPGSID